MIPIIFWEIRRRRLFILWWCTGIIALIAVLMAIYPSIHQQAKQLDAVLQQLPASIRALRGGASDLTSPIGYLNAEVFYISLPLLLIILAVNLGSTLLGRDEQEHTLELVLARPVSRGQVLLGKALGGLCIFIIVGLATAGSLVALTRIVHMDIALRPLLLTTLLTLLFAFAFGALTFALSAASLLTRKFAVAVAVIASFGGYLLESLSSLNDTVKSIAQALPYHYFVPQDLLAGHISRQFLVYMASVIVASTIVAYVGFRRRDLA